VATPLIDEFGASTAHGSAYLAILATALAGRSAPRSTADRCARSCSGVVLMLLAIVALSRSAALQLGILLSFATVGIPMYVCCRCR
jgi:hypothetical protein